jgi:hypothetical protein
MKKYIIIRQYISPPRDGDTRDITHIDALNPKDALTHAHDRLGCKGGTYGVRETEA